MSTIKIISIKFSSVEDHRQLYEKDKNNKTMYIAHIILKSTNDMVLETAKIRLKYQIFSKYNYSACYFLMFR